MRNKRTKSGSNMMNARRASDADVAIGERIRSRRNQIQMSQDELGQALGVSFQQIQKYEKGVNRLSSGRLVELAATLQCSAADLIGGVEKASAKSTPFSRYAASKEGVAIINAMSKISSPALRRHVINLVETLASH
jgi:transcriptional regulator with XRE-family HTH domain